MVETIIVVAIVLVAIVVVVLWLKRSLRTGGGPCGGCVEAASCAAPEPDGLACDQAAAPPADGERRRLPMYGQDK